MALRPYQMEIAKDTLYEVRVTSRGVEQVAPTIEIIGGTGDVYVTQVEPVAPTAGMTIIDNGEDLAGSASFAFLPNYLYVEEKTAISTIILSGIEATVVT